MQTSDFVSILALILSLVSLFIDYGLNKKVSKDQDKLGLSHQMFDELLLYRFPELLNEFLDHKDIDAVSEKIEDCLMDIRKKSVIFRIIDSDRYAMLSYEFIQLDEQIVKYPCIKDMIEQYNVQAEIIKISKRIYNCIYDNIFLK